MSTPYGNCAVSNLWTLRVSNVSAVLNTPATAAVDTRASVVLCPQATCRRSKLRYCTASLTRFGPRLPAPSRSAIVRARPYSQGPTFFDIGKEFLTPDTIVHSNKEYLRHADSSLVTTNTVEGYFWIFEHGTLGPHRGKAARCGVSFNAQTLTLQVSFSTMPRVLINQSPIAATTGAVRFNCHSWSQGGIIHSTSHGRSP
jgi:hypothetical protein